MQLQPEDYGVLSLFTALVLMLVPPERTFKFLAFSLSRMTYCRIIVNFLSIPPSEHRPLHQDLFSEYYILINSGGEKLMYTDIQWKALWGNRNYREHGGHVLFLTRLIVGLSVGPLQNAVGRRGSPVEKILFLYPLLASYVFAFQHNLRACSRIFYFLLFLYLIFFVTPKIQTRGMRGMQVRQS